MKTIDLSQLEAWQEDAGCFVLLDVLPDNTPRDPPLGSSRQRDFIHQINTLGVNKDQPVVLYEADSATIELAAAVEALTRIGFGEIYHFVGPQSPFHASQHCEPAH